jgi:hypothetical protein
MKPELQALARIKLIETRRQRDRLQALYADIERRAAEAPDALARLRVLHTGLKELQFARKPLHPDIAHLDALTLADHLGTVPESLVAERTALLERELAQGRLRAEFTFAFGKILGEWTAPSDSTVAVESDQRLGIDLLFEDPPPNDAVDGWILLESLEPVLEATREWVQHAERHTLNNPITSEEVRAAFSHLVGDRQRPGSFRREATASRFNADLVHEYAGVLTILLNDLENWDWPGEMELQSVWLRVKYRPYLQEDLITALFLEVIGRRWQRVLESRLHWKSLSAGKRQWFHEEPSSPLVRVQEERLERQARRFGAAMAQSAPGDYRQVPLYEGLTQIEAELRLAQARGAHTVRLGQVDIADFYPTLPHQVILEICSAFGISERWLAFFRRFLSIPIVGRGGIRRGLPLEHTLADLFAEVVLWVLDVHLWKTVRLTSIRVVDDLIFVPESAEQGQRAWAAIASFCKATGLEINAAKSGSVGLDRDDPLPRWGLLQLRPEGVWHVDESQLQRHEDILRTQLLAATSILDFVRIYNDGVQYLVGRLVPELLLDTDHPKRISQRMQRLHDHLFGAAGGVVAEIRRRIGSLFDDATLSPAGIPEALLYWPVTAGGLGLVHPLFLVATYITSDSPEPKVPVPTVRSVVEQFFRNYGSRLTPEESATLPDTVALQAPRRQELRALIEASPNDPRLFTQAGLDAATAQGWADFYDECVVQIPESGPRPMPAMEALVEDLIRRGSEVSGRVQLELTPYWRWIVYTYGPAVREALGTFRFLLTELVPMSVIVESRGGTLGGSLGSEEADTHSTPSEPTPGHEIPF